MMSVQVETSHGPVELMLDDNALIGGFSFDHGVWVLTRNVELTEDDWRALRIAYDRERLIAEVWD